MSTDHVPSHHGPGEAPQGEYPNETIRLLHERSSCRSFHERNIPPDVLQYVLGAGIHAATGGNLQPYSIIQIEDEKQKKKLATICEQEFIGAAPVDLLFCIDWRRNRRWAELETAPFSATNSFRHFWISFQDTVMAAQNICTAADALGLGSVYIGTVVDFLPECREMFELPDGVLPVVLLCLGYPKTRPEPRKKLGVPVVVHSEKYRELEDKELLDAFEQKYPPLPPERRGPVAEEQLEKIAQVCREVHGEQFAVSCVDRIRKQGRISTVQRYFGLHYRADVMPADNERFLAVIEDFGFKWFRQYEPKAR